MIVVGVNSVATLVNLPASNTGNINNSFILQPLEKWELILWIWHIFQNVQQKAFLFDIPENEIIDAWNYQRNFSDRNLSPF